MALINCPECGHQVSSYAVKCPNCGCPLGNAAQQQTVPQQPVQQQPVYQQPAYQAPTPTPAPENQPNVSRAMPETHLAKAIVCTILCCWPFGIPAIVNAAKVERLFHNGEYEAAEEASNNANKWANTSIWVAIVFWVLYILFFVCLGASI